MQIQLEVDADNDDLRNNETFLRWLTSSGFDLSGSAVWRVRVLRFAAGELSRAFGDSDTCVEVTCYNRALRDMVKPGDVSMLDPISLPLREPIPPEVLDLASTRASASPSS